ncbi:MAG: glycosyltransferase family 39 protein [Sedimentisphaerales bacterium]|jgi:4-amino-4-deoxy-L-arabinose transferase-like glycosyltransferase
MFHLKSARTSRCSLAIFAFGVVVFSVGLNSEFIGLQNRFALFAQEMLRHGPSLFPTTYGNPYPDYPVTSTFLIYLLSLPFGKVTVLSAILPTAVTSALVMVVIYRIGALQSRAWGIGAVLFALFTYEFLDESRSISLDQYTSLATALCFYAAYSANVLGRPKRLWLIPLFFVMGFGFRGPIGLVIPAAVTFGFFLWERQYKRCLILGLTALCLFALCLAVLLAAAYRQGGGNLVTRVIQAQGASRTGYYRGNYFYYVVKAFTSYAVSFPLAFVVGIALYKNAPKPRTPSERLLGHLIFWVVIVLVGMSIPGSKKTRYILPIVPALSLLASFVFVHPAAEGLLSQVRRTFLGFCRIFPIGAGVGAAVLCVPNPYFTAIPAFPGLAVFGLLIALIVTYPRWSRRFGEFPKSDSLVIVPAVLAFIALYVWVISPMTFSRESTRPFAERLDSLLPAGPATIAFYRIGPDGDDIKLMANVSKPVTPVFIGDAEQLLQQPPQTYFVARDVYFDALPDNIVQKAHVRFHGKIGHRDCVVFSLRIDL